MRWWSRLLSTYAFDVYGQKSVRTYITVSYTHLDVYKRQHYGHIRLLKRAKALGDYLIVGVTADSFDVARGKINVRQTLMEHIEACLLYTSRCV